MKRNKKRKRSSGKKEKKRKEKKRKKSFEKKKKKRCESKRKSGKLLQERKFLGKHIATFLKNVAISQINAAKTTFSAMF